MKIYTKQFFIIMPCAMLYAMSIHAQAKADTIIDIAVKAKLRLPQNNYIGDKFYYVASKIYT